MIFMGRIVVMKNKININKIINYIKNNSIKLIGGLIIIFFIFSLFAKPNSSEQFINYFKNKLQKFYSNLDNSTKKELAAFKIKNEELQKQLDGLLKIKIELSSEKSKLENKLNDINIRLNINRNTPIKKAGNYEEASKILNSMGYTNTIRKCE